MNVPVPLVIVTSARPMGGVAPGTHVHVRARSGFQDNVSLRAPESASDPVMLSFAASVGEGSCRNSNA
jgi:hypothetical protein